MRFDPTTGCRQRSVLCRVGRELVQEDCDGLGRARLQHHGWVVNLHARLSVPAVSRKLLHDQTVKLRSRPTGFHEQGMDLSERTDASLDQSLEIIRRIGMRTTHRCLHGGQNVFRSMLCLTREIDDLRLAAFAFRYVASDFRCPDDFALGVSDRRDGQRNVDQTPILALANGFIVFDALSATYSLYDRLLLFLKIWRSQNCNRLADDFVREVPENSFRAAIPTGDDAIRILADDRIVA